MSWQIQISKCLENFKKSIDELKLDTPANENINKKTQGITDSIQQLIASIHPGQIENVDITAILLQHPDDKKQLFLNLLEEIQKNAELSGETDVVKQAFKIAFAPLNKALDELRQTLTPLSDVTQNKMPELSHPAEEKRPALLPIESSTKRINALTLYSLVNGKLICEEIRRPNSPTQRKEQRLVSDINQGARKEEKNAVKSELEAKWETLDGALSFLNSLDAPLITILKAMIKKHYGG